VFQLDFFVPRRTPKQIMHVPGAPGQARGAPIARKRIGMAADAISG